MIIPFKDPNRINWPNWTEEELNTPIKFEEPTEENFRGELHKEINRWEGELKALLPARSYAEMMTFREIEAEIAAFREYAFKVESFSKCKDQDFGHEYCATIGNLMGRLEEQRCDR